MSKQTSNKVDKKAEKSPSSETRLPVVTLWVPDLLNAFRVREASEALQSLKLPALQTLLAKADRFPLKRQDEDEQASYLFHQPKNLPKAAVMASVEIKEYDDSLFWLRVDPVQMIADRDSLVLIPATDIGITEKESKALLNVFNEHFSQDQVELEYASATAWYLKIKQPVDIQTHSLASVAYQPVNERYPSGNAASYWRQLLNETQMLFYAAPVNERRREQGIPEINSVWMWGEGRLNPSVIVTREAATVWSENNYLMGLAKIAKAGQKPSPINYQAWWNALQEMSATASVDDTSKSLNAQHHLIRLDTVSDSLASMQQSDWLAALEALEQQWLVPLEHALKKKELGSVLLDFGGGYRYHLKPAHLRRFWRFKKSLIRLSEPET